MNQEQNPASSMESEESKSDESYTKGVDGKTPGQINYGNMSNSKIVPADQNPRKGSMPN